MTYLDNLDLPQSVVNELAGVDSHPELVYREWQPEWLFFHPLDKLFHRSHIWNHGFSNVSSNEVIPSVDILSDQTEKVSNLHEAGGGSI